MPKKKTPKATCDGDTPLTPITAKERKFLGDSTIKMTADIYTHTSAEAERDAAIALERAIYGDLFPVVPNIENRNNFATLNWAKELLRLNS